MSAYDRTEFLRTAYRPFAYCVPSKSPLNTAYQKGGCHPHSDLLQYRILFCNAIDDCRKELWETIIEQQGHSAFNRMRCSDLLTQCNYITFMLVTPNHDTF